MFTLGRKVGVVAAAAIISGSALYAGISATKHNLMSSTSNAIKTSSATFDANQTGTSEEICVFCHTPHAANVAFSGAPLWNKASPTGTFAMYGTTIGGTTTDATPNSSSMACLSCHDGASALNSIVNMQGSGLVTGTITMNTTGNKMPTTSVANLDTNLTNDHPISIQYKAPNADTTKNPAGLKQTTITLTGWLGATDIAGLLRGPAKDRVECGSCHDPHTSANARFLRASNAGSALCTGCHDK